MEIELPDGYEISTDPARLDAELIHRWLSLDAYWTLGRSRETHDRAIAGSLNFGVYGDGAQAGYARVVTDEATFAWLCDVYVSPALRGRGLGKALVAAVRDHLAAQGVDEASPTGRITRRAPRSRLRPVAGTARLGAVPAGRAGGRQLSCCVRPGVLSPEWWIRTSGFFAVAGRDRLTGASPGTPAPPSVDGALGTRPRPGARTGSPPGRA